MTKELNAFDRSFQADFTTVDSGVQAAPMTFGQAVGTMTAPSQPTKHYSVQTGRANANAATQTQWAATQ